MITTLRRPAEARGSTGRRRRLGAATAAIASLGVSLLGVVSTTGTSEAAEPTLGVIESAGPLTSIATSADLNCDVRYAGDTAAEFYGTTACGTLVAMGGTLYGPASIPAGSSASPRTGYTPVSQVGPTGQGSAADPFTVITKVDLGSSGVSLTQTDTYVTGQQNYRTTVRLTNGSGSAVDAIVYRAGDCYLANSDYGLGNLGESSVACVASGDGNRVEQWIPITAGSHRYEAGYDEVWARIGAQQQFPDTCRCAENIDNGAGLSWGVTVPAGGQAGVSHLTAFSAAEASVDRDGDGLLDDWETQGYDADGDGVIDLDLPAMGASPDHKDLFVEVDWMVRQPTCIFFFCWGGRDFAPDRGALQDVAAAFASAPVSNPDGRTGVTLHVDSGPGSVMNPGSGATWGARSRATQIGWVQELGSRDSSGNYSWSAFNAIEATSFEAARRDVFHYAIYGDRQPGTGSSGIARVTDANFEGSAFLVTDGDPSWGSGFSRRQESGTFMHEFGHTLGLRHGGGDNANNKPNYQSIMNYLWQLSGRPLDYSDRQLGTLDEGALDEQAGLANATGAFSWYCGSSRRTSSASAQVDWNCSGAIDTGNVSRDLTNDGATTALAGWNDWSHLVYDGGAVGAFGASDLADADPAPAASTDDEPRPAELRTAGAFGDPGDGSVRVTGPNMLLKDVADQKVWFHVTNVGTTDATYRLNLSGLAGLPATVDVQVPALGEKDVAVPVDGSALAVPGGIVAVKLTAPGKVTELSGDVLPVVVPDMSDANVRAQVEQILAALATSKEGLPDPIRVQVGDAIRAASPAQPPVVDPTCTTRRATYGALVVELAAATSATATAASRVVVAKKAVKKAKKAVRKASRSAKDKQVRKLAKAKKKLKAARRQLAAAQTARAHLAQQVDAAGKQLC